MKTIMFNEREFSTRMDKKKWFTLLSTLIYIAIILAGGGLLLNRVKYGVDFTDESWYVAEAYIVSQGAIPFVNNWSQAPGFTMPLAVLFKLFISITGGTEGIFLFARILYCIWHVFIMGISMALVGKQVYPTIRQHYMILLFPMILIPYGLYYINYNTIGVDYLFLSWAIMYSDAKSEKKQGIRLSFLLAGTIIARAIIGTPYLIVAWVLLVVSFAVGNRWNEMISFLLGNMFAAVAVIGWCCIMGGIESFFKGLENLFFNNGYFKIKARHTLTEDIKYLISFVITPILCMSLISLIRICFPKKARISLNFMLVGLIIISIFHIINFDDAEGLRFTKYLWFVPILIKFSGEYERNKKQINDYSTMAILFFAVYLFSSLKNIYGFGSREYWLIIPSILSILLICYVFPRRIIICIMVVSALIIGGSFAGKIYNYVYRDEKIEELISKVDNGVWKGCYTIPERSRAVEELEGYIRMSTKDVDKILFLDWAAFGYTMTNAKACTYTTLDPMKYTYKVNDPSTLYNYFKMSSTVPSVVMYIDYGRDRQLSIEDDWKFNWFMDEYYDLTEEFCIGTEEKKEPRPIFRVLTYRLKEGQTDQNVLSELILIE